MTGRLPLGHGRGPASRRGAVTDPTRRFTDRVEDYVRYRPGYPSGLLPLLEEELGIEASWTVADIGAGTGLSARPFLELGYTVIAVEPNGAMRAAADAAYGGHSGFRSVAGTAEDTGLPPGSVDLVTAGQAFHWFDPDAARRHFLAILRPPFPAALIWNTRLTEGRAFLEDYEALLVAFGTDYDAVRHDRIDAAVLRAFFRGGHTRRTLPNAQLLDWPGLRGRLLSSSYTPGPDHPDRPPMLRRLRAVFDDHQRDGRVRMDYVTEVYAGWLAPRTAP
jgi:SAM-dependent methyltransferase